MSALFPDRTAAAIELREDRLNGPLFSGSAFSPRHLERMIASAEGEAERHLRVFFGPVSVLPAHATTAEREALDAAGTRWIVDPGYALEPGFLQGDRWGLLQLRHRPVSVVHKMEFVYPPPTGSIFTVPAGWIQLDQHAGDINIVPTVGSVALPLPVMLMMTGGRTVPHLIQVRYTAGILNPQRDYPELSDLVMQIAAIKVLKALMLPGSGSVSADGLSQSRNVAIADYQGDIDERIESLRQAIHGVTMSCL